MHPLNRALGALLLLCACTAVPKAPEPRDGARKTFRIRYSEDIRTLDWTRSTRGIDAGALKNIMEGLVDIGLAGEIRPRLAESYSVSSDGETFVFKLRDSVRWTDGEPLKARQFVDAWRDQPWMQGISAEAIDDRTLEVKLLRPDSHFLWRLAFWAAFPVRKELIERYGEAWTDPAKLVTLGPFRIASWEKGKRVVLARNEAYWDARPPVDEVVQEVIVDDAEAARRYAAGELAQFWPATGVGLEAGRKVTEPRSWVALGIQYLMLSNRTLSLPQRRRIASAIDRSKLLRKIGGGHVSAESLVTSGLLPAAGPMALEEGRRPGKLGLGRPLRILALDEPQHRLAVLEIARQLSSRLGARCETRFLEGNAMDAAVAAGEFDVALETIYPDWPDASSTLEIFRSRSYSFAWRSAELDRLLETARETEDGAARAELYRQALHVVLREDVAAVPLFHPRISYFLGKGVKGFAYNPLGDFYYRTLDLEPEAVRR